MSEKEQDAVPLFGRSPAQIRPQFPAIPAEPTVATLLADALAKLDELTRLVDGGLDAYRRGARPGELADYLLDMRTVVRPAGVGSQVPVIPGRAR